MIALVWGALAFSGTVDDGVAAFEAGRLEDAIAAWSTPRAEGRQASGVVEYNLGTAWLRIGDPPRAIAHLRAAARLRPRDGSVHHNLALARSELQGTPPAVSLPSAWMSVVTPGELGLLGVLLAALGSAMIVGVPGARGSGRRPGVALLVVGLAVGGVAAFGAAAVDRFPIAVVVDAEALARDAPSVNAGERFRLPPGAEVGIEKSYRGFLLVQDGHGRRGWLATGAIELGW